MRGLDAGLGRYERHLAPLGQEALGADRLDPRGALGVGEGAGGARGVVLDPGGRADQDSGAEAIRRGEERAEGEAPAEGVADQRGALQPEGEGQLGDQAGLRGEGERLGGDLAVGVTEEVGGEQALAQARREGREVGAGAREAVQSEEGRLLTCPRPAADSQPPARDLELVLCGRPSCQC